MQRSEITELHYLAAISNVSSILTHGILCHTGAQTISHIDLSMAAIQKRRASKQVPNGLRLHDYVNLYFNGRNKMMAACRPKHSLMCVLRIKTDALDVPGAIISDQNASSDYALFLPSPAGLKKLSYDEVFAQSWICPNDQIREWRLGSIVCAELLIPSSLDPNFIFGAYAPNEKALYALQQCAPTLPSTINSQIFL
jgi:hypothetical protein